jgi:hypothetical protein
VNRFAPVQLDPIEAWDLLNALNEGQNGVLGFLYSRWRTRPREGIDLVLEQTRPVEETTDLREWMRDPLPPSSTGILRPSTCCAKSAIDTQGQIALYSHPSEASSP